VGPSYWKIVLPSVDWYPPPDAGSLPRQFAVTEPEVPDEPAVS
jgi:hypothetical protein